MQAYNLSYSEAKGGWIDFQGLPGAMVLFQSQLSYLVRAYLKGNSSLKV